MSISKVWCFKYCTIGIRMSKIKEQTSRCRLSASNHGLSVKEEAFLCICIRTFDFTSRQVILDRSDLLIQFFQSVLKTLRIHYRLRDRS